MKSFLPVVVLIFACIGFCSAGRCYVCNSLLNTGCSDTFKKADQKSYLQDCGAASNYCFKTKAEELVIRSCGAFCSGNECASQDGLQACCCSGDGCNSATTRRISYVAMVAMVILTKLTAF